MPNVWNALFLGNIATSIDPFEGNNQSENAGSLVGTTFGSAGSPLANEITEVTAIDNGGFANALDTNNNAQNDQLQFDVGSGLQTTVFDGIAVYSATLTYMDNSTASISAVIFQDTSGNLFMAPEISANLDSAAMEAGAIQSLTLGPVITSNAVLAQNRLDTDFICFAAGTRILTPIGQRPIEKLKVGDLVCTVDNGPQPILWTAQRSLTFASEVDSNRPIEIKAGALGHGAPKKSLLVSPQHRIFIQHPKGKNDGLLAPAVWFEGLPKVRRMQGRKTVEYHSLMFEKHELVFAEGTAAESFLPGEQGMKTLSPVQMLSMIAARPKTLNKQMRAGRPIPTRRRFERLTKDGVTGLSDVAWSRAQRRAVQAEASAR